MAVDGHKLALMRDDESDPDLTIGRQKESGVESGSATDATFAKPASRDATFIQSMPAPAVPADEMPPAAALAPDATFIQNAADAENLAKNDVTFRLTAEDHDPLVVKNTTSPGDGKVIAGRYRIVRRLGKGGMGEVFEAEDLELGDPVAVKTILPDSSRDTHALARFRREIQLARKVTHRNVCRIFDVFHHEGEDGSYDLVTMEFLRGETLQDKLKEGPLAPEEAMPIIVQMARGLHEAHRIGIAHRDFKPSNVMLCAESDGATRAVVTDFGLARLVEQESESQAGITSTGDIVGTPAYMSPEQVEGEEITPRTDVYSFGLVMYEMLTGVVPFRGGTAMAVAYRRVKEDAPPPRSIRPELDPMWDGVIMRCLQRDPKERYGSLAEVVEDLTGESIDWERRTTTLSKRRPRFMATRVVPATLIVLAIAAAIFAWIKTSAPPAAEGAGAATAASTVELRRSVAVLGFKNLTGKADAEWMSTALAEMIRSELAAGDQLRIVPGETVARVKQELSIPDADSLATDTLGKLAQNLGSDYVVLGSYLASGPNGQATVRLDLKLQSAADGSIQSQVLTGLESDILDLVSRTGSVLRESLGLTTVTAADLSGVRASLPDNPAVARPYAEGLMKLRVADALAARESLNQAIEADPEYPLAHAALADAHAALGYDAEAKDSAKKAFDLSTTLSREEKLSIEGRYREATFEWDKAIEIYQTLVDFYPDNLEYGLKLAVAEVAAGRATQSLKTVKRLRRLPAPLGEDPRIDLAAADAHDALSDYRNEMSTSQRAARVAESRGALVVLARAKMREAVALGRLGEPQRALEALVRSRDIFASLGDRGQVARVDLEIGSAHLDQADFEAARAKFERSLEVHREIGDQRSIAVAHNNLALLDFYSGDVDGAIANAERALEIDRSVGDRKGEANVLATLGQFHGQLGELRTAKQMYEESLATSRSLGDKLGTASALGALAALYFRGFGDLPRAEVHFAEALEIARTIGNRSLVFGVLNDVSEIKLQKGELAAARAGYEEALSVARAIPDRLSEATASSNLALTLFHQGQLESATQNFEAALKSWDAIGQPFFKSYSLTDYGEALCARGDLAGCRAAHEDALRIREEAGVFAAAAESRLNVANVMLSLGQMAEVEPMIRQAITTLSSEGNLEGEARGWLTLGRAQIARGDLSAASQSIEKARTLASGTADRLLQHRIAVGRADLAIAGGKSAPELVGELRALSAREKSSGYTGLHLESELALARLFSAGDPKAATARLKQIESEAGRLGYGWIQGQSRKNTTTGAV